jgi:hypothetical protein
MPSPPNGARIFVVMFVTRSSAVNPHHIYPAGINRNGGPAWIGILARHAPKLVAGIDWNTQATPGPAFPRTG